MDAGRTKTEVHGEQESIEQLLEALEKQQQVIDELRQTIKQLQRTINRLKNENERLRQRLGQYEPEALEEKEAPSDDTSQYSVEAEEKRRRKRKKRKKKSPGRRRTAAKFAAAEKSEQVVPAGFSADECCVPRKRAVWRLIDGRAVLVGYTVYRAPGGEEPPIPGVSQGCRHARDGLAAGRVSGDRRQ